MTLSPLLQPAFPLTFSLGRGGEGGLRTFRVGGRQGCCSEPLSPGPNGMPGPTRQNSASIWSARQVVARDMHAGKTRVRLTSNPSCIAGGGWGRESALFFLSQVFQGLEAALRLPPAPLSLPRSFDVSQCGSNPSHKVSFAFGEPGLDRACLLIPLLFWDSDGTGPSWLLLVIIGWAIDSACSGESCGRTCHLLRDPLGGFGGSTVAVGWCS